MKHSLTRCHIGALLFIGLLSCLAGTICSPAFAQVSFGQASLFNEQWLFYLGDDTTAVAPAFDDSKWRTLDVPHDWSIEGQLSPSLASCTGYLPAGIAWYRKHFQASHADADKWFVYFEGIYNRSSVYLNGHLLGYRPNGYVSFMYDMTPYLVDGDNVLAVRVDHSRSADSRWYTGSGIYRDVYLIKAPNTRLAPWGASYEMTALSADKAEINVGFSVCSDQPTTEKLEIQVTLADASGKQVAKGKTRVKLLGEAKAANSAAAAGSAYTADAADVAGTATTSPAGSANGSLTLKVPKPHLWSVDDPYLYSLNIQLLQDGVAVDQCTIDAGLRTVQFDPNKGFFLNGRNMKLKGVCLHHDAGVLGAVVPEDVWARRLANLKSLGVNAIRLSHNPQAPVVYALCDRLGLMVIDEISDEWEFPKRKWLEGWNVGTPGYQGSYDFFEAWIEQDITDMVLRDRHHPSVILWSIGNEVDYPNDPYSHPILDGSSINQPMFGGYHPEAPDAMRIGAIAKRLATKVRAIDTSRPVTGALAGVVMSNETGYPEAIDVVGYNYTEDRYDADHKTYPDRVIYGSETSVGYSQWKAVLDRDFISGQFLWTGTDYLGESGAWPSRGLYTGLLDFGSFRKPRGWFRASLWSETPVTYIGTYPTPTGRAARMFSTEAWDSWNYQDGQSIRVVCYTNAPFARLLLNGREVGTLTPYDHQTGVIGWDIPFAAGTLVAEGCDADGNVLSQYAIETSGRPYALRVSADKDTFAQPGSVIHLTVEIVDEAGRLVTLGDNNITCTVTGPAKLLGLEASDNTDMTDYSDNRQRAFKGRLLAYVVATDGTEARSNMRQGGIGQAGPSAPISLGEAGAGGTGGGLGPNGRPAGVTVRFSSPLLQSTEIKLNTDFESYPVPLSRIQCSDPFIFADQRDHTYYMYGTGGGGRITCRASKDLANWTESFEIMRFPDTHWAGNRAASWAAELHLYNGKYYLFTTSHTQEIMETHPGREDVPHRATQIYVSDSPRGPFRDFTNNKPHTPWDWASLDGTLWIEDGIPYMVFCHEWLQTLDGTMEAVRLPADLGLPTEAPFTLFTASEAQWSGNRPAPGETPKEPADSVFVTDGPWLFKTQTGRLGMLWSTWDHDQYAIGTAYSQSGTLKGPWIQEEKPLFNNNGGHGMLFRTFEGKLTLCMHWVNPQDERPGRKPIFRDVDDSGDRLVLLP